MTTPTAHPHAIPLKTASIGLARLLKLYRVFILTKNGDNNPPEVSFFRLFRIFVVGYYVNVPSN